MNEDKSDLTWKRHVWPYLKKKAESIQWLVAFMATIFGLLGGAWAVYLTIKSKAQSAVLDDPKFLGKLAEQVRPVCLLDSRGYFYDDYGGLACIDGATKIEVATNLETISITIRVKSFLRQPPMITSMDGSLYLIAVDRQTTDSWRYIFGAVVTRIDVSMGYRQLVETNRDYRFRVEVLH